MRVKRLDVIDRNRSLVFGFIPAVMPGDDLRLLGQRAGDKVVVTPDGLVTEQITVIFKVDGLMAVSDGCDLDDINNLLHVAANGAVGAVGTGLGGGMRAADGIAGATVSMLKEIMNTPGKQGNIVVLVRMTDVSLTQPPADPTKIRVTGSIEGWTRTTDTDSDEIANISYKAKILAAAGNEVKTENAGKSSQIPINSGPSVAETEVTSTEVEAVLDVSWNLLTDGALFHDTVSLIQISTIKLVLEYPTN